MFGTRSLREMSKDNRKSFKMHSGKRIMCTSLFSFYNFIYFFNICKIFVMQLLTLKRLKLHFTNPFNFMQFQLLKVETQSVQVCWICTTFRSNQRQFERTEVPSLEYHMVYPRLPHPSYELERAISRSNLTIYEET